MSGSPVDFGRKYFCAGFLAKVARSGALTFLTMTVSAISTEGAPSLRFLQGWAAMLRVLFDLL
jgi:hypothetical protein